MTPSRTSDTIFGKGLTAEAILSEGQIYLKIRKYIKGTALKLHVKTTAAAYKEGIQSGLVKWPNMLDIGPFSWPN